MQLLWILTSCFQRPLFSTASKPKQLEFFFSLSSRYKNKLYICGFTPLTIIASLNPPQPFFFPSTLNCPYKDADCVLDTNNCKSSAKPLLLRVYNPVALWEQTSANNDGIDNGAHKRATLGRACVSLGMLGERE